MPSHIKRKPKSRRRMVITVALSTGSVLTGGSAISARPAPAVDPTTFAFAQAKQPARDTVAEYLAMRDYYEEAQVSRSRTDQQVKNQAEESAKLQAVNSAQTFASDLAQAAASTSVATGEAAATSTSQATTPRTKKAKGTKTPKSGAPKRTASKKAPTRALPRMAYSPANVIVIASRLKGVHYRAGGTSPDVGFDCSGYTSYVFGRLGVKLPHTSDGQYAIATKIKKSQAKPGDLVFWHGRYGVYHVAIYAGNGKVWHSPFPGKRVQKVAIWGGRVSYGRLPSSLL